MAARLQAPELHVRHVAEPGERMPVGGMARNEGPADARRVQASADVGVGRHVLVVVVDEELVPQRGQKRHEGQQGQRGSEDERPAAGKGVAHAMEAGIVTRGYGGPRLPAPAAGGGKIEGERAFSAPRPGCDPGGAAGGRGVDRLDLSERRACCEALARPVRLALARHPADRRRRPHAEPRLHPGLGRRLEVQADGGRDGGQGGRGAAPAHRRLRVRLHGQG